MKYENVKCPYCNKPFTEDSDVVVCPECGTPHHRECYLEHGACANENKHDDDFSWESPIAPKETQPSTATNKTNVVTLSPDDVLDSNKAPNGTLPVVEIDANGNARPVYRMIKGDEKLGDYTVEQYGEVIQKNVNKYIPKFLMMEKTKGKTSVNFAAFFFGPFWLFYRKMYKYGFIAMLIMAIIPIIFFGDVVEFAKSNMDVYAQMSEVALSDASMTDAEFEQKVNDIAGDAAQEPVALSIANTIELFMRVGLGFFGNFLYMKHCSKLLDNAKSKCKTDEDRKLYFKKSGGRSLVSVLLCYLAAVAFISIFGFIYLYTGKDIATLLRRIIK